MYTEQAEQQQARARNNAQYRCVEPEQNAEKMFGNAQNAPNWFDEKTLGEEPAAIVEAREERRRSLTANLNSGPRNAFEEQIELTKQGRMWPFPIDNEYLLGDETNVKYARFLSIFRWLFLAGFFCRSHFSRSLRCQEAHAFAEKRPDRAFYGTRLRWPLEKSVYDDRPKARAS